MGGGGEGNELIPSSPHARGLDNSVRTGLLQNPARALITHVVTSLLAPPIFLCFWDRLSLLSLSPVCILPIRCPSWCEFEGTNSDRCREVDGRQDEV